MAYESACLDLTFANANDLSAKQFYFVKMSASNTIVVCAAATDKPIGVLQNKPTANQAAVVRVIGCTKVSSEQALAAGNLIGTSADGEADVYVAGTDTTKYFCGQVIEASTAAHGYATAIVNCAAIRRGA